MTYKLNSIVEMIQSPIILRFEDTSAPEYQYANGQELANTEFDKKYLVSSVSAENSVVIVTVKENKATGPANWAGEETVSFF